MALRQLVVVPAAALLVLLAPTTIVAAEQVPAQPGPDNIITFATVVTFDATRNTDAQFTATVSITAPATLPSAAQLVQHGRDDPEFATALATLFQEAGGPPFDLSTGDVQTSGEPASVNVDRGMVTLSTSVAGPLRGLLAPRTVIAPQSASERDLFPPAGLTIAPSPTQGQVWPWGDVELHIRGGGTLQNPPPSLRKTEVHLKSVTLVSADPVPTEDNGLDLAWTNEPGSPSSTIIVRVRPNLATAASLWLMAQNGPLVIPAIISQFVSQLVVVIWALRLLCGAIRVLPPETRTPATTLYRTLIVLLLVPVLANLPVWIPQAIGFPRELGIQLAVVNACLAPALIVLLFWWGTRRTAAAVVFLVLIAAAMGAPALVPSLASDLRAGPELSNSSPMLAKLVRAYQSDPVVVGVVAALNVLAVIAITFSYFGGIARLVRVLAPSPMTAVAPQRWRKLEIALSVLVALVFVQWMWSAVQGFKPGLEVMQIQTQLFVQKANSFSLNLIAQSIPLLTLVALSGLIGMLYLLGRGQRTIAFPVTGPRARSICALLFAGFVVGSQEEFFGLVLPLGTIIGFFALRRVTRACVHCKLEQIDAANPGLAGERPLVGAYQCELLERARALAMLRQRRAATDADYTSGKIDEAARWAKLAAAHAEEQRLTYGSVPTPTHATPGLVARIRHLVPPCSPTPQPAPSEPPARLRLPEGIMPGSLALSLGPSATWWGNAQVAIGLGGWIAVLPLAYSAYVLITQRFSSVLRPEAFGLLSFLVSAVNELVFWLTIAFVFGCLYGYLPGPNGVLKACVLAGVYSVSRAVPVLLQLILAQTVDPTWTFRCLEVLLYLVTLGVVIDLRTLASHGMDWRQLADYYVLGDARVLATYLSPLAAALIALAQQILTGQAQAAINQALKTVPLVLPQLRGP